MCGEESISIQSKWLDSFSSAFKLILTNLKSRSTELNAAIFPQICAVNNFAFSINICCRVKCEALFASLQFHLECTNDNYLTVFHLSHHQAGIDADSMFSSFT